MYISGIIDGLLDGRDRITLGMRESHTMPLKLHLMYSTPDSRSKEEFARWTPEGIFAKCHDDDARKRMIFTGRITIMHENMVTLVVEVQLKPGPSEENQQRTKAHRLRIPARSVDPARSIP